MRALVLARAIVLEPLQMPEEPMDQDFERLEAIETEIARLLTYGLTYIELSECHNSE